MAIMKFKHTGKLDPNKGGGPGSTHGKHISAPERGGTYAHGQKNVPGGRASRPIPSGHGGSAASIRIGNAFGAARGGTHVGAHASHPHHPHNLPSIKGFGKGPVDIDD